MISFSWIVWLVGVLAIITGVAIAPDWVQLVAMGAFCCAISVKMREIDA